MANNASTTKLMALASAVALQGCAELKVSSTLDNTGDELKLNHPERPLYEYEKCYGVAKKGQNSCFSNGLSCAGTATEDRQANAWIYLPKGTCEKLAGGSTDHT